MRKMYYIGSHMGELNDGYICSSKWMQRAYARRPEDFKRRIIYVLPLGNTHYQLLEEEFRTLQMVKPSELGVRYYNRSTIVGFGTLKGGTLSAESRQKIGESKRGRSIGKGLKRSETTKQRIRLSMIGRTSFTFAGQKHTPETRAKMSAFHKGKPLSEEHKQKLSLVLMGNKRAVGNTIWLGRHHTEETKQKLRESGKRYKPTEETKRKLKIARAKRVIQPATGLVHSEKTRQRLSLAHKAIKRPTDAKGRFLSGKRVPIEMEQIT